MKVSASLLSNNNDLGKRFSWSKSYNAGTRDLELFRFFAAGSQPQLSGNLEVLLAT